MSQSIVRRFCVGVWSILFCAITASACTVPVYRYALERWNQDLFAVYVFTKGDLESPARETVNRMAAGGTSIVDSAHVLGTLKAAGSANIVVITQDVTKPLSGVGKTLWEMNPTRELPWVVVRFPLSAHVAENLWEGSASSLPIDALLNSPARTVLERSLLSGESVTWVFIPSGNKKKDRKALKALELGLDTCRKVLKLPELEQEDIDQYYGGKKPILSLSYSMIVLDRKTKAESLFVKMLTLADPQLKNASGEPAVFPLFGRGRTLYGLAGAGITTRNILEANAFLCGPCACTVKEQNPGKDLLFSTDWAKRLDVKLVHEKNMPSLQGLDKFMGKSTKTLSD